MDAVTRKVGTVTKPTVVISKDGDKVVVETLSTFRNTKLSAKLGEEFDETTPDDRKVKVMSIPQCKIIIDRSFLTSTHLHFLFQSTFTMENGKFVQVQKWDGKETTFAREIKDGKMVMVR